jgi:hypothetical protein
MRVAMVPPIPTTSIVRPNVHLSIDYLLATDELWSRSSHVSCFKKPNNLMIIAERLSREINHKVGGNPLGGGHAVPGSYRLHFLAKPFIINRNAALHSGRVV